jgi:4-carboxymuconolactone decarboxylase
MAISDAAAKNHDELFPGHVSTLKITDPELIEYFDNFAFDEVLRHGGLDTRTRLMVQLASMIACQAVNEYRVMLGAALPVGNGRDVLLEVITQLVPFIGYPRSLNALRVLNEVTTK